MRLPSLGVGIAVLAVTVGAAPQTVRLDAPVTVPFELVMRHVVIPVTVKGRTLSFVLDTGDKVAIIDLERATELGLVLGEPIHAGGVGAQSVNGAIVRDTSFSIAGVPSFSQPVTAAIPLKGLASKLGHDFDGILGHDFIRQFVVELDYARRTITLHDPDAFRYAGVGESIPITLNGSGHPIVEAEVTPIGRTPVAGKFTFDIGAGGALAFHSPFVVSQRLPGDAVKTIRSIGTAGAGGTATGRIGRVAALKIGTATFTNPPAMFSEDTTGAFASAAVIGNIGALIISRFRVFLDYGRERIILEPAAAFGEPFTRASAGMSLHAEGDNYTTFTIDEVLEDSPAAEAGLRPGDVIAAIDARNAPTLTLTKVTELFEISTAYTLTIRRGSATLAIALKPRVLF